MASKYTCQRCLRATSRQNACSSSQRYHPSQRRTFQARYLQTAAIVSQHAQQQPRSNGPVPQVKDSTISPRNEITTSSQRQSRMGKPNPPAPSSIRPQDLPRAPSSADLHAAMASNAALHKPVFRGAAAAFRRAAPVMTETYVAYGATQELYGTCASQADYKIIAAPASSSGADRSGVPQTASGEELGEPLGERAAWWYRSLGLPVTFSSWAQVTFLHMYVLTTRFRMLDNARVAAPWHQHLVDRFFFDAEDRMSRLHAINRSALRKKYLKDLNNQWRGAMAGYDEAVAKRDDALLAAALWRNVFRADENVNAVDLATVTSYLLREVGRFAGMGTEELLRGRVEFGNPEVYRRVVLVQSELMKKPFEQD